MTCLDFDSFLDGSLSCTTGCLINTSACDYNDVTAPIIVIISPENNTINETSNNITFIYNVTDPSGIANCSLIINEIVSNSLKHGFPNGVQGQVTITINKNLSEIELIIEDNGIGIPDDCLTIEKTTLGMQLIDSLTSQLNGTLTLKREHGTKFILRFNDDAP